MICSGLSDLVWFELLSLMVMLCINLLLSLVCLFSLVVVYWVGYLVSGIFSICCEGLVVNVLVVVFVFVLWFGVLGVSMV